MAEQLSVFVLATAVSEELPAFFSVLSGVFLAGAGVADEPELSPALLLYPSEYHPPPFSWKELLDMSFLTGPEQSGHTVRGLSVMR